MKRRSTAARPSTTISNCNFYGVKWDPAALDTVQTVARALENLTRLFASGNVKIESMVRVGADVENLAVSGAKVRP